MVVQAHPKLGRGPVLHWPELGLLQSRRQTAPLHLFTYVVGNALFWTLWGAVSVSSDHWYWCPLVPAVGWALVLAIHLANVYGSGR